MKTKTKIVGYQFGIADEYSGNVTELHLTNDEGTRVAQISELPHGNGFLIRVWPINGTHEYGGNNSTLLSSVVENDSVTSIHTDVRF